MKNLYAILRLDTNEIVWSKVTTHDEAQYAAIVACFHGYGNISLLSGADLGRHLLATSDA